MLGYRIEIVPDDTATFLATCPALPELTTFGEDRRDAARRASDAVEEALAARMSDSRDLPPPERVEHVGEFATYSVVIALKFALYRAPREEGMTRAASRRRPRWPHREQVDRLLRVDHVSRDSRLEEAFRALGRGLEISVKPNLAA